LKPPHSIPTPANQHRLSSRSPQSGAHAITANKGVLVYGYRELNELAARKGKAFSLESTVLDSAPVFSLFREDNCLPFKLRGFSGVI